MIGRFFKKIAFYVSLFGALGLCVFLGVASVIYYEVQYGDDSSLKKTTILAKIKEETSIFYLDEETRIGSIFDSGHRQYVPFNEIPESLINAIIAAEDKNFYSHIGIDPSAIFVAFMEGMSRGGRFRRGGSTITQQTVKNIVDDWEASFVRKFREMIKAFQLEKIYSKEEILEFYLNQFHVAGNGSGVGIAAKYYFDKDVRELTLVESAFIAGSVKGPGKYNPFIKFTEEKKQLAIAAADDRKNYVISRMLEQNWITSQQAKEAYATSVPFKRGEFRSSEVALVDLVKAQLSKPEILAKLGLKNKSEFHTAGLKVYTTLDASMQTSAQKAMRRNLSRLETILKGFHTEDPQSYKDLRMLTEDEFYFGKIIGIVENSLGEKELEISFGLPKGRVSHASLVRYAKLLDLSNGKGYKFHLDDMLSRLKINDVLFLQVLSYDKVKSTADLELQKRPDVSGGLIALDQGEVRAVISGFDTIGYNRAINAKRQAGSAFKSLAFFAGLQLGWNVLDRLDNFRMVFPYQGDFYYPRPDHKSPYDQVSMLWTGVMSENIAAVDLGARLLEKTNFDEFKQVLGFMGLLPKAQESAGDYIYRVEKTIGVSIDQKGLYAYALKHVINEVATDIVFSEDQDVLLKLRQLWWGERYLSELNRLRMGYQGDLSVEELKLRVSLVRNNFMRMKKLYKDMTEDFTAIKNLVSSKDIKEVFTSPEYAALFNKFRVLSTNNAQPVLAYYKEFVEEMDDRKAAVVPVPPAEGRTLNLWDAQMIWGENTESGLSQDRVRLDGALPAHVISQLEQRVEERYQEVLAKTDEYRLYSLFSHYDFRIGLGLNYALHLAKACGVSSKLDPVLSLPLGTSDISAGEIAKLYQTFVDGKSYRFFDEGPDNQITFIRRIEDRLGHVLYKIEPKIKTVVSQEVTSQMREILGKVVTHGTGRRARGELHVEMPSGQTIRVPAFGKTGTTNDFKTSYFAGFLPYPSLEPGAPLASELDPKRSYVISTYVGYDWNQEMRKGRERIYGGGGALPVWVELAKSIIKDQEYVKKIDGLDLKVLSKGVWSIKNTAKERPFLVDLPRGLILRRADDKDQELWKSTDIALTGEDFNNPFAVGPRATGMVYLPFEAESSTQVDEQRALSLYDKEAHKTSHDQTEEVLEAPVEGEEADASE
jgi:penicillin-binding protein 1A